MVRCRRWGRRSRRRSAPQLVVLPPPERAAVQLVHQQRELGGLENRSTFSITNTFGFACSPTRMYSCQKLVPRVVHVLRPEVGEALARRTADDDVRPGRRRRGVTAMSTPRGVILPEVGRVASPRRADSRSTASTG